LTFIADNYFILIFLTCIAFVSVVAFYKLFISKPHYVYARVKVGQGLWWASTQKPSYWMVKGFKKGEQSLDLTGKPTVTIEEVRYYPYSNTNQYDIYLTLKLMVSSLGKSGKYNFNRSTIGIGAPIDLEFPDIQVSGTIINLSPSPFKDQYIEKTIYLANRYAYSWDYDNVKIGDSYFDGVDKVFEIIDKSEGGMSQILTSDRGRYDPTTQDVRKYTVIKARVKVKKVDGQYIFGEEQVIANGKTFNMATPNFSFVDYMISKVE
jgi:hypothetical protein